MPESPTRPSLLVRIRDARDGEDAIEATGLDGQICILNVHAEHLIQSFRRFPGSVRIALDAPDGAIAVALLERDAEIPFTTANVENVTGRCRHGMQETLVATAEIPGDAASHRIDPFVIGQRPAGTEEAGVVIDDIDRAGPGGRHRSRFCESYPYVVV